MSKAYTPDINLDCGRILRHETMRLPTMTHLEALAQLVREAYELNTSDDVALDMRDWQREARKVLFG